MCVTRKYHNHKLQANRGEGTYCYFYIYVGIANVLESVFRITIVKVFSEKVWECETSYGGRHLMGLF